MGEYLRLVMLIERLHRLFLEVIKLELERLRIHDVTNVQAILLFNIGDDDISVGELISRGYYAGTNVSYNVRKLSDIGYLRYERSEHDRRSIRVRLSAKGRKLRDLLTEIFTRQKEMIGETQITENDLQGAVITLQRLQEFWLGIAR